MMRWIWSVVLLLLVLAPWSLGQEPGGEPQDAPKEGEQDKNPAADAAPQEPPVWRMDEKDRKRVEKALLNYLDPGRKTRQEMLGQLQKTIEKITDVHSPLEDVETLEEIATNARTFAKVGRKGKVSEVEVPPDVHHFPGGVGTVTYWVYLPNNYDDRKLWPLIFCLPDNKQWRNGGKYIEDRWITPSPTVGDGYIVVVPSPRAVGDPWHRPESWARAMIALRHVCGNFDSDKKTGGPAVDIRRVFVDGQDVASELAARFPEILVGAILRHADGKVANGSNLREVGGLSGLPAYCVVSDKRSTQFAEKLKGDNPACVVENVASKDEPGSAEAMVKWMEALPRPTQPREIEYTIHGSAFQRHYWINVLEYDGSVAPAASFKAQADRARNEVRVETNGVTRFELFLNDAIVDLNREVRIVVVDQGIEYEFLKTQPTRELGVMLDELVGSNHPWRIYPAKYVVDLATLRKKRAAREAAAKAGEKDKQAKSEGTGADAQPQRN